MVLVCLATYRVTRLITRDKFPPMAKFRYAVGKKFGSDHWASYLVGCAWCVSVYVSAGIVSLTWHFSDLPYPLLMWPVASAVTGLITQREKIDVTTRVAKDQAARNGKESKASVDSVTTTN